ncbi:MAG: hypothetical protein ILNGONEN_02434 [Syntrophorhabdaceae bacterium]|nr:hypothetical protein [Syntrophorhabdaceae bacterium]
MIRMTDSVSIHHLPTQIRYQRNINRTDAALGYRCVAPGIMREMGIHRDTDHFHITPLKIFRPMRMCNDFRWADEGEIKGVEKQYCIFIANMGMKIEIFIKTAIRQNGRLSKIGSKVSDEGRHYFSILIMLRNL